jgi:hypothetical protein
MVLASSVTPGLDALSGCRLPPVGACVLDGTWVEVEVWVPVVDVVVVVGLSVLCVN